MNAEFIVLSVIFRKRSRHLTELKYGEEVYVFVSWLYPAFGIVCVIPLLANRGRQTHTDA